MTTAVNEQANLFFAARHKEIKIGYPLNERIAYCHELFFVFLDQTFRFIEFCFDFSVRFVRHQADTPSS